MRHLDLFSGIGGFALGLQRSRLDVETIGFCEIDKYATRVLNKNFPDVPVYHDVRTLDADRLGTIDIITGGYPCQPFSVAGKQRGTADDRHLWPEMHRIVATTRPTWVIAENVAGHIKLGLDQVLSDLENEDYTAWPVVIPACAKDAPHRRDRVWVVAHSKGIRREGSSNAGNCNEDSETQGRSNKSTRASSTGDDVANATAQGLQDGRGPQVHKPGQEQQPERCSGTDRGLWPTEPAVGRVAHGIPSRVDRLKGLGNAIVPQIVTEIANAIHAMNQGR
ncbi:MAG: DNA (cytosine-5-)-methyltransferase [Alphaproteobacteria bacterium]|nr:DNA (cytosine-5-)-methyltransferase [Alphaproteobacteria bacterium]